MEKLKGLLNKIRSLNNNHIFEDIYVCFLSIVTILFWGLGEFNLVPSFTALIIVTVLTGLTLLIFNDFKYFIFSLLCLIMGNPRGYIADKFPYEIVITGFSMVGILLIYTIINYKKITFKGKNKSFFGIAYLAVFEFLPITYCHLVDEKTTSLIWIYFSYLLYLGIYLFFLCNLKSSDLRMTRKSLEYMGIVIAFECAFKVIHLHLETPDVPILRMWYFIGWCLCNEAGILLCMTLPFVFLKLKDSNKVIHFVVFGIELAIYLTGMALTTSRGTYLFGTLELITLILYSFFAFKKNRLKYSITIISLAIFALIYIQFTVGINHLVREILNEVFYNKLSNNGRVDLYDLAIAIIKNNPISFFFGNSMIADRIVTNTQFGMQEGYTVFHSTFFETFACFGLFGVFALMYHFYEKYKQLHKFDKNMMVIMLIGYVFVDLYGMIDNSYSFYYYMIPLVIIMSSLDAYKEFDGQLVVE